jgi:aspartate/glutamate racemase
MMMRSIGLIGAMSRESTAIYVRERLGGLRHRDAAPRSPSDLLLG